jgi:hypothetical protein
MQLKSAAVRLAALAILGFAAQAGSATAASTARPVRIPAPCSHSVNPYMISRAALRACGDNIAPLLRVTPLVGGGKAYFYGDYTRLVPPAGFNVLKASDKQLSEYGLPTRKQLGSQWYKLMSTVRHFAKATPYLVQVPGFKIGADISAPGGLSNNPFNTNSANWAGFDVNDHNYTQVTATWTEPHFVGVGCTNDKFSQWVGIGGLNGSPYLGQDGTAFNEPGLAAHQGWIETINNDSSPPVAADIIGTPGSPFYASTLFDVADHYFNYYMQTGSTVFTAHSRTVTGDQSHAEVVSEMPFGGPSISDFQTVPVQSATAYWDGGSSGFYGDSHNSITMTDSHQTIVTPGTLSSGSNFTTTWKHCN